MTPTSSFIFDELRAADSTERTPWIIDHQSSAVETLAGEVTPHEIGIAAGRIAHLLSTEGMSPGDYCTVWLESPLDILVAGAAITALGAVPILISPHMSSDMLGEVLQGLPFPPPRLITTSERKRDMPKGFGEPVCEWADIARQSAGLQPFTSGAVLPGDAPYVVTHTSGTTGIPKLVQYTRGATDHNARIHNLPIRAARLRQYAAVALSPTHYRSVVGILASLRNRVPVIVLDDSDTDRVASIFERYRPTYLETLPNTFLHWEPLAISGALKSVRFFFSTFDVIHPGTVRRMLEGSASRYAVLGEVYGQSEITGISFRLHLKGVVERTQAGVASRRLRGHPVGFDIPGHATTRIVDHNGRNLPPGVPGRILVKSAGRFSTYLNRPEAVHMNLLPGNWWDTGDCGSKDRYGRLTLLDRQIDRLSAIPSGIAMEDLLLERMPWLLEVVMLESGRQLTPVVATRRGISFSKDMWSIAVCDLPPMLDPIVMEEANIPRTSTGKVRRKVLGDQLTQAGAALVQSRR